MDKSVPPGAALLLAFIYQTETSRSAPDCYEVIYGNRQLKLAKPLTQMTLAEVQAEQRLWSRAAWAAQFGSTKASSAAGAPQLMKDTLAGLIKELGLRGSQSFNGDLQDRLGFHLLKRRGYDAFMAGTISRTEFGKRLAQEWASFPVLAPTQGGSRNVVRGQSYYAGDGLNKSLVTPETVEALLDRVKAAKSPAKPAPTPSPAVTIEVRPAPTSTAKPTTPLTAKEPAKGLAFFLNLLRAVAGWVFSRKEH